MKILTRKRSEETSGKKWKQKEEMNPELTELGEKVEEKKREPFNLHS